jgi:GTP-dependent phosphoenolpyruvate carboxykinase
MPSPQDIDLTGMEGYDIEDLEHALALDVEGWKREALLQDELFINLHGSLPTELMFQRELLIARL